MAALIVGAGCGSTAVPGVTDREVVLGITAPLSGPAAAWGTVSMGAAAWARHVNAQGGVHGRTLRVVLKDDAYIPGRAVGNVSELKDSAFAIVALLGTAVFNATKQTLAEAGVPVVYPLGNPRAFATLTAQERRAIFVAFADYVSEGEFLARQALVRGGSLRPAVFYQNDDFGRDALEGVKRALAGAGGQASLAAEVAYELQDRELTAHALRLRDSGADTLLLFATPTHGANVVKATAKVGYRPRLFASFVLSDHRIMFRLLGGLWDGVHFPVPTAVPGEPAAEAVLAKLLAQEPRVRGRELFALQGSVAMMMAVEGLRRAGRDLTRESFVQALEGLRDWEPEGLGQRITFGPGRRHGANALRLLRTGTAADGSAVALTDYQSFPPLY